MGTEELVAAWRANEAVNHDLLALCSDSDLDLKPGKGKTVRSNYVHIIGFRRAWVETSAKQDASAIKKLDWKTATRKQITDGLKTSSAAMESAFAKMAIAKESGRRPLMTFFAYCVAHEANHRSQIEIALRINGREPDDAKLYALWEWKVKV